MIFPKPPSSYDLKDYHLKFVTKDKSSVPCMMYRNEATTTDRLLIFFHGNAEDIGMSKDMIETMMAEWNAHGVAVEYPTYGVYKDRKLSEKSIREDALLVYDTISKDLGVLPEQIIIVGRSIGSGAATYLASQRSCGAFLLISPMKSINDVAGEHICVAKALCCCFCCPLHIFQNKSLIKKVRSPTYIVHGEIDEVINVRNGKDLHEFSGAKIKDHNFPPTMTHNRFILNTDIIDPFTKFMKNHNISISKYPPINGQKYFESKTPLVKMNNNKLKEEESI